jgi:type II secretory pathway component PulM
MSTHSPAEWAAFLSLGTGLTATGWLLWLLLFEPLLECDLDPRPALRRTAAAVHEGTARAGRDVNRAIATSQRASHDAAVKAAITAAALLALLIPTAPKGVTR